MNIDNTSSHFLERFSQVLTQHLGTVKKTTLGIFTPKEHMLLGAFLMNFLYQRTKRLCRTYHEFHLKTASAMLEADEMMDRYLSYYLMQDLMATGNFTLEGLAAEVRQPLDVITDIASGTKLNHSPALLHRLIKLHVLTKKTFHSELIRRLLVTLGYW